MIVRPSFFLAIALLAGLPGIAGVYSPDATAGPHLAQVDARERALRQEFTRQRYERERREREEARRERRAAEEERRRQWTQERRSAGQAATCARQAVRTRETLQRALDAARTGGESPTPEAARNLIDEMRRAGCDALRIRELEQQMREARRSLGQ